MTKLYTRTKKILDWLAEARPNYQIKILEYYNQITGDILPKIAVDQMIAVGARPDIFIPIIPIEPLLTLIPELFGKIENPKYEESFVLTCYKDYVYTEQKSLSKALLQRYFVDGLWLESQEKVLEDLWENVKTYL
jgi:hypothetical protein